jgi:HK97 family phage major capsid protein
LKALAADARRGDRRQAQAYFGSREKAALAENSGPTGGYLTPVEYSTALLTSLAEESWLLPRCRVVPMTSAETVVPVLDATTAQSAGTSPFFGGFTLTWVGSEGTTLTESEPKFRDGRLVARDLLVQAVLSNQFWADIGPAGEEALMTLAGQAAAWGVEYAVLRGTGVDASPIPGILASAAAVKVSRAAPNAIALADVAGMAEKLLPAGWRHAVWGCHPSCLKQIGQITGFIPNQAQPVQDGYVGTLFARALYVTDKLPALGTTGDLVLLCPPAYAVGLRQSAIVEVSAFVPTAFQQNQSVLRVWVRVAGLSMLDGPVTLTDGSKTAGVFVILN